MIRKLAKEIAGKRAGSYAPMYLHGTEMVSTYYNRMRLKDKRVLTIAGSGDQIIDAYFAGAKDVVGFDLNKLVKHFIRLKWAAIQKLSYKHFLHFFGTGKKDARLGHKVYRTLRDSLPAETCSFFDNLYVYFEGNGKRMASSEFFHDRLMLTPLGKIHHYLKNEKNYLTVRKMLADKKPVVLTSNVTTIAKKRIGKFDLINLSNVPNFLTGHFAKTGADPIDYLYNTVFSSLRKLLKQKGTIIYYTYDIRCYPNALAKRMPDASDPKQQRRMQRWKLFRMRTFTFPGLALFKILFKNGRDKVIVLQKPF